MPVRHARSETRGRPPFGPTGWSGKERFDEIPQRIGKQRGAHPVHATLSMRITFSEVLLNALSCPS